MLSADFLVAFAHSDITSSRSWSIAILMSWPMTAQSLAMAQASAWAASLQKLKLQSSNVAARSSERAIPVRNEGNAKK